MDAGLEYCPECGESQAPGAAGGEYNVDDTSSSSTLAKEVYHSEEWQRIKISSVVYTISFAIFSRISENSSLEIIAQILVVIVFASVIALAVYISRDKENLYQATGQATRRNPIVLFFLVFFTSILYLGYYMGVRITRYDVEE